MKKPELLPTDTLVSVNGGSLDVLRHGEVVASISVPPGAHSARRFLRVFPPDCDVQVADGVAVMAQKPALWVVRYGKRSHDTGANPDYVPTSASTMQRQLDYGLKRLAALDKTVSAKLRGLQAIDSIPKAPKPHDLVEPTPAASPAPAPADGKQ